MVIICIIIVRFDVSTAHTTESKCGCCSKALERLQDIDGETKKVLLDPSVTTVVLPDIKHVAKVVAAAKSTESLASLMLRQCNRLSGGD